ncbi:MAG: hypothetical protein P1V35_17845, partial [Planctomycetota bacterium]|nr:hypothetical protein [Planctomycetota bacterium]
MNEFDQRKKRNLGLGLVAVLCAWFAWNVRSVLNPLLLAYLLAFIVHPFVLKLEGRGWTRKRAVNTIYLLAMVCGLVFSIAFWNQGSNLFQRVIDHARGQDAGLFTNLDRRFGEFVDDNKDSKWAAWLLDEGGEDGDGVPVGPDDPTAAEGTEGGAEPLVQDAEMVEIAVGGPGSLETESPESTAKVGESLHLLPALQRVWNEVVLGAD